MLAVRCAALTASGGSPNLWQRHNRVVANTRWCLWTFEVSEAWPAAIIYGAASFACSIYIGREGGANAAPCWVLAARHPPRLIYINCTLQIYSAVSFLHTRKEGSISYLCQTAKLVSLCAPRSEFRLCLEIFKYQRCSWWCGSARHALRGADGGEKV
jgi:hypothetical protein